MADGTYAGDPTNYPAVIRFPEDGEDVSETDGTAPPIEDLGDRTAYAKARLEGAAGEFGTAGTSVTRVLHGAFNTAEAVGVSGFFADTNGSGQQVASGAYVVYTLIEVPHGATLTAVSLMIAGAAGHAAFPGGAPTMPTLDVQSFSTAGAVVGIASVTDASATAGVYEGAHALTASGLSTVIDRATKRYYARLGGEAGANFIAGLKCYTVSATWTPV